MKTKKKTVFRGTATALVTPFCNGEIDFTALARLIDIQIQSGITALVIGGTTGEAATLSDGERYDLYKFCAECIRGRAKMILGTGTNDTRVAIQHTKEAERLGADGALVVTPYYNKGTASGLAAHYEAIAAATDIPLILYNVPSRTGVNIGLDVLERLARLDNIVGIKEASDSHDRLVRVAAFGDDLPLYAGNDSATYTVLSLGGAGVISVVSNICPDLMREISDSYFAGRTEESLLAQIKLLPLIEAMFVETNPAPVKYALSRLELCREEMRLPMQEISGISREKVERALAEICK